METVTNHQSKEEKTFGMTLLLDFYGELLSEGQRRAMEAFYGEDLSLAEIAELIGITRQGVRDRIVKGERILVETERKLGLVARFSDQKESLSAIAARLEELRPVCGEQIEEIRAMMEALL